MLFPRQYRKMPILVKINKDKMEAVVEVEPGHDAKHDADAIKRALKAAGVIHGVDEAGVTEVAKFIEKEAPDSTVRKKVAKGTPPVDGVDGSFTMTVEYDMNPVGLPDESGNIDFHERGSYTPIEQGQLLAEIVPPTQGTPGKDVLGGEIRSEAGNKPNIMAGQGTKLKAEGAELRAIRSGDLRYVDDRIEVIDLIKVSGNLDYKMGSIECEGSVRVEGDVLPDFHIRAGGDVSVGGVVDAAEVSARGAVVVRQGIARGSRVHSETEITAGYVSGAYLECEGKITILKEAVHSTVVSGDSIIIPGAGRVIGGALLAQKGVDVGIAGHVNGLLTTLAAGVNPLKDLRAAKLTASINQTDAVRKRIGRMAQLSTPGQQAALAEQLLANVEDRQSKNEDELAGLKDSDTPRETGTVKINRETHAGVRIRIGPAEMDISEEHRGSSFHYDVEEDKVVGFFGSGGEK